MSREKKPPLPEDDDGRTIVPMDVDGMPWRLRGGSADNDGGGPRSELSPEELRRYKWAAVKAGLLVVLVFAAVFAAFIAFCDFIWFK